MISGKGDKVCFPSHKTAEPATLTLNMYLIDANTHKVLTWYNNQITEPSNGSLEADYPLCQAVSTNSNSGNIQTAFSRWLHDAAAKLARQMTTELLRAGS